MQKDAVGVLQQIFVLRGERDIERTIDPVAVLNEAERRESFLAAQTFKFFVGHAAPRQSLMLA
jgi:hypothetical protein